MRVVFAISFVSLLIVTIASHLVPKPAPANSIRNLVPENERKESQSFILDMAKNFSSFYFQKLTQYVAESQIVSPLSVFIPMSMLSHGARGVTRQHFQRAMGLPKSKARMAKIGYKKMLDELAKYDVRIKTKFFVSSDVELNSAFVDLCTKVFNAEIETVHVTDGFMDNEKINKWVANQTNGNVTTLFKPREIDSSVSEQIDRDPSFVLVNTVYFKGTWKKAFDSSLTAPRPFHVFGSNALNVPTMKVVGRFRYGHLEDLKLRFIELPYKSNSEDNAMSMFIILPDVMKPNTWAYEMMPRIRNMSLHRLLNSTEEDIEVFLPKFKIETTILLNEWFRWIFKPEDPFQNRANFSGIFKSPKESNFGESMTKIVIEVDEEGHETAGSSGLSYNMTEPVTSNRKTRSTVEGGMRAFNANHPFVAMIVTKGKILTELFSIYQTGCQFLPKDVTFWE